MTSMGRPKAVFVSYARRDHDLSMLIKIAEEVYVFGVPYVDDLHDHGVADRVATVIHALSAADIFVAVWTSHYRLTPWTCAEFCLAIRRGIPIIARLPDGRFVGELSPEWPWCSLALVQLPRPSRWTLEV